MEAFSGSLDQPALTCLFVSTNAENICDRFVVGMLEELCEKLLLSSDSILGRTVGLSYIGKKLLE